jgi:pyruvate formate lyase activating enzyme
MLSLRLAASDAELEARGEVGFVHSWQAGSMVDGPGVRFVVWTTGCHFRCQYCHNPDTWKVRNGRATTVDALLAEIDGYAAVLRAARGGVTITGGEPLVQTPFVRRVMAACKERGLHTALDTNGHLGARLRDRDLDDIDLVLLDLKAGSSPCHRLVTRRDLEPVHAFARRLSDRRRPTWIRFVLVPGLTDDPDEIDAIGRFASTLESVERVEVLPFQQLGRAKWQRLGVPYLLDETPPPVPELVDRVRERLRGHGLPVVGVDVAPPRIRVTNASDDVT